MSTRRETAQLITAAVVKYYTKRRFCVNAEIGLRSRRLGMLRADVLALNMKHEIIIVEVKSSYADFKNDDKYELYLPYCNKMYIACNEKVYHRIKDSVNDQVGLMVIDGKPRVMRNAKRRDVDHDLRLSIITRLAFRNSEYNRYRRKRR